MTPVSDPGQSSKSRFLGAKHCYEDYLAVIADLLESKGYARIVIVAEVLGVRSAFVSGMIRRLADKGWGKREHYRCIFLTDEGGTIAAALRGRRQVLMNFFAFSGCPRRPPSGRALPWSMS